MEGYVSGDDLSEEEDEVNFTHFDSTDPVYFKEAVKCEK